MPRLGNELMIDNCISDLRQQSGLTQQDLADLISVTRATVVALERGGYNPSLELAFRVARVFGVRVDETFFVREESI